MRLFNIVRLLSLSWTVHFSYFDLIPQKIAFCQQTLVSNKARWAQVIMVTCTGVIFETHFCRNLFDDRNCQLICLLKAYLYQLEMTLFH